jgi:hypothetical protein
MRKKLVFIGIGLLVLAVILFVLSGYLLTKGFSGNISFNNITIGAHNFSYSAIHYNKNSSAMAVYALLGSPADIYVFNSSTFTRWYAYMNPNKSVGNGYHYASSIDANSAYLFSNATIQVIPLDFKNYPVPTNGSGSLYIVIDNTGGSKSAGTHVNASISYIPLNTSTVVTSAAVGYGVLISGLAGIILIIWGLLKKDEQEKVKGADKDKVTSDQKRYLDQLYKGVKKGKSKDNDS